MSSIHAALFAPAAELLIAVQGEEGVTYQPPGGGPEFAWPGCIVGAIQHGIEEHENSGDLWKVTRRIVHGPRAVLVAAGVTELHREAIIRVDGVAWNLDLTDSSWGAELVRVTLIRRPIARRAQMEDRSGTAR